MIKTIIFDLGGVYFTDGTRRAIQVISKKHRVPIEKVTAVLKGELGTKYRIGQITAHEFWEKAKKQWGIQADETELAKIWLEGYKPIQGMPELVDRLKKKGYETIFLSDNVQERVDYLESKYHFLKKFKGGIFSHIVKTRKPDKKIYQLTLQKASNKANECVYIDDKIELLKPAQELGMKTIKFETPEKLKEELRKIDEKI